MFWLAKWELFHINNWTTITEVFYVFVMLFDAVVAKDYIQTLSTQFSYFLVIF